MTQVPPSTVSGKNFNPEGQLPALAVVADAHIAELNTVLLGKIPNSEKGIPGGVATLGNDGKLASAQAPGGGGAASYRGAVGYITTDPSIPTGTPTVLNFDGETIDTDSIHSTTVNPSRFVVPAGVTKVVLKGQIGFASGAANTTRRLGALLNGTPITSPIVLAVYASADGANATVFQMVSQTLAVTAGDYLEIQTYHENGSSLGIAGAYTWGELVILG